MVNSNLVVKLGLEFLFFDFNLVLFLLYYFNSSLNGFGLNGIYLKI